MYKERKREEGVVETTHFDILTRILYIYAKLNPGIKYVQGMNELLAPLYYIFNDDKSGLFLESAESDSFYCFTILMSEAKDGQIPNYSLII